MAPKRTREEKRQAVLDLLSQPLWEGKSDRTIAGAVGVSPTFVGKMRRVHQEKLARDQGNERMLDELRAKVRELEQTAADQELEMKKANNRNSDLSRSCRSWAYECRKLRDEREARKKALIRAKKKLAALEERHSGDSARWGAEQSRLQLEIRTLSEENRILRKKQRHHEVNQPGANGGTVPTWIPQQLSEADFHRLLKVFHPDLVDQFGDEALDWATEITKQLGNRRLNGKKKTRDRGTDTG